MTLYGERYLTVSRFRSYCAELKIMLTTSELESYEREGVLLPAARIIKPDEYVIKRKQTDQQTETYGQKLPEWGDLERLLDRENNPGLWHPFDWEFEKKNEFLLCPKVGDFKAWDSFKVEVKSAAGEKYSTSSVEHYYHYWQAYLVDKIQSKYPVFAKHNRIFGIGGYFDALSFFIGLNMNEERLTFAPVAETDGVKQLSNEESAFYREHLKDHAQFVLQRFDLNLQELYQFLVDILEHQADYRRNERLSLAEALGNDAIFLSRLISWATGQSIDEMGEEIGKQAGSGVQKQFRHLDKALEIYDYALETFRRLMGKYNETFPPDFSVSLDDIDRLLKFIEEKRLFIIPYAIFEIDEALNDPKRFRWTSLYIGINNLATGFECFLRETANLVNQSQGSTPIRTDGLFHMIQDLLGPRGKDFQNEQQYREENSKNDMVYIEDVYTSPSLDNTLKAFLIAHKARNFTAHKYTLEPYFYHYLYSIAYAEICNSLFYSWKYASRKGWV
jgi:hypothetical protein